MEVLDIIVFIVGFASLMNGVRRFEPYEYFIHWVLNKIFGCRVSKFRDFLLKLFTCEDCMTFWGILIFTLNPLWAGIGYVVSNWISKKLDNLWTN